MPLKATTFQSLFGRPCRGKIVPFGQVVFGLDPKADKYRPAWIRGAWLGKDSADMDLLTSDGQSMIRTRAVFFHKSPLGFRQVDQHALLLYVAYFMIRTEAVRRIGEEWDATLVLGVEIIPSQVFGYRRRN